jgi:hypothetical protein
MENGSFQQKPGHPTSAIFIVPLVMLELAAVLS